MADDVQLNTAAGSPGDTIAADDIGGVKHQRVKVQYGADGSATDVSTVYPLPVALGAAQSDAFGRFRVSNPETLFDSKQIYDNQPLFWDDAEVSGSGTTSTHSTAEARTRIGVSATTAGKRVRQTFRRFNYQPGKSQLVLMTAVISSGNNSGITANVGYFDDNNGIFFSLDDTTLKVVQRSSVSGSPVDTAATQATVNGDPLDGTGDSGYTLDPTKTQIMWLDIEWLGVGRVRTGFVIDGKFIQFHEFLNANNLSTVYMSTPNLPVRYEIANDGTGAATTMDHICCTVISEGGLQDNGVVRAASTGTTVINANTAGTYYVIHGIRLKTTALSATVKILNASIIATTSDDYEWQLRLNPTIATGISFADQTNSVVQTGPGNTGNPSTSTATGGTIIASGFVKSGVGGGAASVDIDTAITLGAQIDGTRDEIYLVVAPFSANSDIAGGITWRELL